MREGLRFLFFFASALPRPIAHSPFLCALSRAAERSRIEGQARQGKARKDKERSFGGALRTTFALCSECERLHSAGLYNQGGVVSSVSAKSTRFSGREHERGGESNIGREREREKKTSGRCTAPLSLSLFFFFFPTPGSKLEHARLFSDPTSASTQIEATEKERERKRRNPSPSQFVRDSLLCWIRVSSCS